MPLEDMISLQELIRTIKKYFFLILSLVILAVGIAGLWSYYFSTPIYQATTQILVNQQKSKQNQFNSQDIQMNLQLIETYNVIISSPIILSKVIDKLELDTSPDLLAKKIKVNSAQNSQVVNISVQDPNLRSAVDIANSTVEVFQEEIRTLMNVDNVKILSPAVKVKNQIPIKPDPILYMAVAGVIGLLLGIGITFLMDYLDITVKTEQDVEMLTELPIMGLVSHISDKEISRTRQSRKKRKRKGRGVV